MLWCDRTWEEPQTEPEQVHHPNIIDQGVSRGHMGPTRSSEVLEGSSLFGLDERHVYSFNSGPLRTPLGWVFTDSVLRVVAPTARKYFRVDRVQSFLGGQTEHGT